MPNHNRRTLSLFSTPQETKQLQEKDVESQDIKILLDLLRKANCDISRCTSLIIRYEKSIKGLALALFALDTNNVNLLTIDNIQKIFANVRRIDNLSKVLFNLRNKGLNQEMFDFIFDKKNPLLINEIMNVLSMNFCETLLHLQNKHLDQKIFAFIADKKNSPFINKIIAAASGNPAAQPDNNEERKVFLSRSKTL